MRPTQLMVLLLAAVALWGCKADRCEGRPAEAQIEARLDGISPGTAVRSKLVLRINGAARLAKAFSRPTPSFVFEFEQYDRPPRSLEISVTVYDQAGAVVGSGELTTTFSSNGCNSFSVIVRPKAAVDAGAQDKGSPDAPPTDGGPGDVARPDGPGRDGTTPDASPPDAPIDRSLLDQGAADSSQPDVGVVPKWTVYTLAGSSQGFADRASPTAMFNGPIGLAIDSRGAIYVADQHNDRIRKVSAGQVSTFAGSGTRGFSDGAASKAQFNIPADIAIATNGGLYIADHGNLRLRLVSGAQVTTVAGTGAFGYFDGPALSAQFKGVHGVAIHRSSGDVYIAEHAGHRIRKLSTGQVSTVAGDGTAGFLDGIATSARFNTPIGLALDSSGRVYVADMLNHRIRLIQGGRITTLAGSGRPGFLDGPASSAKFNNPTGVAVDRAGNVYVADRFNHRIRLIANGQVTTIAGTGKAGNQDGAGSAAQFADPMGIAVDASGKTLYVADLANHRIRKITSQP